MGLVHKNLPKSDYGTALALRGCGIGGLYRRFVRSMRVGMGINQLIAESSPRAGLGLVIKLLKVGLVGKTFQLTYAVDVRPMRVGIGGCIGLYLGSVWCATKF